MFENLQLFQNVVDPADNVAGPTEGFPRGYYFLVDQLNRVALSIATNLAEGNGRFTQADWRNFFTIARGSAQELVPLVEVAWRRGLIQEAEALTVWTGATNADSGSFIVTGSGGVTGSDAGADSAQPRFRTSLSRSVRKSISGFGLLVDMDLRFGPSVCGVIKPPFPGYPTGDKVTAPGRSAAVGRESLEVLIGAATEAANIDRHWSHCVRK